MENWAEEREKLRKDILQDFQAIQDRKKDTAIFDKVVVNPKTIARAGSFSQMGPILFGTNFTKVPTITFGQIPTEPSINYVVLPFTKGWYSPSGVVEGFYIGLYALMDAPAALDRHTVTWYAVGKASRYKGQNATDWTANFKGGNPVGIQQQLPKFR